MIASNRLNFRRPSLYLTTIMPPITEGVFYVTQLTPDELRTNIAEAEDVRSFLACRETEIMVGDAADVGLKGQFCGMAPPYGDGDRMILVRRRKGYDNPARAPRDLSELEFFLVEYEGRACLT